jgi:hypothetical protein
MRDQEVRRVVADVVERFWKWSVCVDQCQLSSCLRHEFGHCGVSILVRFVPILQRVA